MQWDGQIILLCPDSVADMAKYSGEHSDCLQKPLSRPDFFNKGVFITRKQPLGNQQPLSIRQAAGPFTENAPPEMARRFRQSCKFNQLQLRQREIPVNKIVVHRGHGKEIEVSNRHTAAADPDIPGLSQREHAFDLEGASGAIFKNMRVSGT